MTWQELLTTFDVGPEERLLRLQRRLDRVLRQLELRITEVDQLRSDCEQQLLVASRGQQSQRRMAVLAGDAAVWRGHYARLLATRTTKARRSLRALSHRRLNVRRTRPMTRPTPTMQPIKPTDEMPPSSGTEISTDNSPALGYATTWLEADDLDTLNARLHDGVPIDELLSRAQRYRDTMFGAFPEAEPRPGDRVLELGSGVGWIMEAMLERFSPRRDYRSRYLAEYGGTGPGKVLRSPGPICCLRRLAYAVSR